MSTGEHPREIAPAHARPIRVVEVVEATAGGVRRHLLDLARGLDPARFAVAVVCATRRDPAFLADVDALRRRGIPVTVIQMVRGISPVRDTVALWRLVRHLRRTRPDIVHTHSSKAGVLGRLAARLAGVGTVVHTPHAFPFEMEVGGLRRTFYVVLEKWLARSTARLICVAPTERSTALAHNLLPAVRICVIENGIEIPEPAAPRQTTERRRALGIADGVPVVGVVGRLCQQKGHCFLVSAARQIVDRRQDVRFVFVGGGPLEQALAGQIAALGLQQHVIMVGQQDDTAGWYGLFDVLAMPSLWEALPYVLLEGMAAGRAIVASGVGGVRDLLEQEQSGLLVRPKDIRGLAEAVLRLLDDTALRKRLGDTARRVVATRSRLRDMVSSTEMAYEQVFARQDAA